MYLLVGLGNPGKIYSYNRHNIGYMVIDNIAKDYELPSFKIKNKSSFSLGFVDLYKVILLKPTYPIQHIEAMRACVAVYIRQTKYNIVCVSTLYWNRELI